VGYPPKSFQGLGNFLERQKWNLENSKKYLDRLELELQEEDRIFKRRVQFGVEKIG
jgi:hypothetical protein